MMQVQDERPSELQANSGRQYHWFRMKKTKNRVRAHWTQSGKLLKNCVTKRLNLTIALLL